MFVDDVEALYHRTVSAVANGLVKSHYSISESTSYAIASFLLMC
jgi:hypothetical protein